MTGRELRAVTEAIAVLLALLCAIAPLRVWAQPSPIQHIVVIVQENRTVDNLFNGFPGADTQNFGMSGSTQITLQPEPLNSQWDIGHMHHDFLAAYSNGNMNGFNGEACAGCPANYPYSYVPQSQVQQYWALASTYTLADEVFETHQGPSFPAHQYLLSGTAAISNCASPMCYGYNTEASENGVCVGCSCGPSARVPSINVGTGVENFVGVVPCFNRNSIVSEILAANLTARYYQEGTGADLWHGPDAIQPLYTSAWFANYVVTTPSQVITDVGNGTLANVTWVTPTTQASDHAGGTDGSGPAWVASVVNAIGQSQFWNSTAIFVTWDDWGGWYDHAKPSMVTSYRIGFRVPVLVISPYARLAYVSHTTRNVYGSLLAYIENNFGLPSLGTSDVGADAFTDCFNYSQQPTAFAPISGVKPLSYWRKKELTDKTPVDY
jgi:phospholipase C